MEQVSAPNASMIDLQPEVQWYMRPYLLDFLVELHQLFRLQPATLFLAINIIDRYCARRIVFKRHYQLVGCTALWIAGKYEDKKSRVPTLRELSIMCRHAYDDEMFVQMEMHILATLEWSVSHPSLEECLQLAIVELGALQLTPTKYNKAGLLQRASAVAAVGRFFCELSLYDRFFLTVPALLVATAATYLACLMLQVQLVWPTSARQNQSQDENQKGTEHKDTDKENEPPIVGSFLLGFDSSTMDTLRKIALVLFLQTTSLSEVLLRKYDALGVIPVLQNFNNRHPHAVKMVVEGAPRILADDAALLSRQPVAKVADLLLLISREEKLVLPLTPPSASHSSVFSQASDCGTVWLPSASPLMK